MWPLLRGLLSAATAAALTAPAVAAAQELPGMPAGSDAVLRALVLSSAADPASSGSSELPLGGPLLSSNDRYPLPLDESIDTAEVLDRKVERADERVERWYVSSPSMARVVEVQIKKAADPTAPAPMVYLLDGIGGSTPDSGSLYSDWEEDDPALGRHMWETFITEELRPLLAAEPELNFNGDRDIGGLSMGAIGAVHLANTNPGLFDAVFDISGCHSPTDDIGRQMVNLVVSSLGGDVENMWGPYGSDLWNFHDTTADPEGLRNMAVYLSAADGSFSEADRAAYDDTPFYNMIAGAPLERGVLHCTGQLDRAMRERGMTHQTVDYKGAGVHNWDNYNDQLRPAWETIRPSLFDPAETL